MRSHSVVIVEGGRDARAALRAKAAARIKDGTDEIAQTHMPYLIDASADCSGHRRAAAKAIAQLEKKFTVTKDYAIARRHLAQLVLDSNREHGRNLAVPPRLTRTTPQRIRRTKAWCRWRRDLNSAHEKLMAALSQPEQLRLGIEERLGLVLYFAVTYGGLGDARAVQALREILEQGAHIKIHCGLRLAFIWLQYNSKGSCNAFLDGKPIVYRPWFITTACRPSLLAYLKQRKRDKPETSLKKTFSLIRNAFIAVVGKELPIKGFGVFCRVGGSIIERQPGVDLPEILMSVANGSIESSSLPPSQLESLFADWRYFGEQHE